MNLKETFRTFLSLSASEDGSVPSEIQIMPLGVWDSPTHGEVSITAGDAQEFIDNFTSGKYRAGDALPIDLDHDGGEAAGWITALELKADGLWASVEWTPLGKEKIQSRQYRFFSPEFCPVYQSPQDGSLASNVLIGGGLVNRPFFKDMVPVACSERGADPAARSRFTLFIESTNRNDPPMEIKAILEKAAADRTAEEQAFLAERKDELTPEQRAEAGIEEAPAAPADPAAPEEPAAPEAPAEPEAPVEPVQASEKITITAAEKADYEQRILAGEKALRELRAVKMSEKVRGFLASDGGSGKFPGTTAVKEKLLDLYLTCGESQAAKLDAFIAALPDSTLFGEAGSGSNTPLSAREELEGIANKKFAASEKDGKSRNYGDCLKEAASENPDLAKRYEEERSPISQ